MKLRIENLAICLLISALVLGGCSGCAQKNAEQTPLGVEQHLTPIQKQSPDGTIPSIDPILDVKLERIELPPDFNAHYGKSYFGITENNEKPPAPDEYYADPLFWIPDWEIRTERYFNGNADSFLVMPDYNGKFARYEEQLKALKMEQNTLTRDDYHRISAEVKSEGLSNLHAAKYFGAYRNPYALAFAEKAHEENPDDFHTLWVLAYLQKNSVKNHRARAAANYQRLIEMNPNVARVWYEYAKVAPTHDEKIAAHKKSFELDPTLFYGTALRSLALNYLGRAPDKSIAYLKQWDAIFPNEEALFLIKGIEENGAWHVGHHHH